MLGDNKIFVQDNFNETLFFFSHPKQDNKQGDNPKQ